MRAWSLVVVALLAAGLLAGCATKSDPDVDGDGFTDEAEIVAGSDPENSGSIPVGAPTARGPGDAVVIAVVDGGFNPYHFDMLAAQMPQATNEDGSDDLPLDEDPANWLPGHPGAAAFASYSRLGLTLPTDGEAVPQTLHDADKAEWAKVQPSAPGAIHMSWIPGTKVIGLVNFAGGGDGFAPASHGVGTSSVSVGNIHGSCPECLLVFVHGTSEQANRWVEEQDWIDVQTNSWGISSNPIGLPRDRVYAGSDTESQRAAIERGQQIFFSAGNGLLNDFSAPNPTLLSSQEGPDWIVTVGAVTPDDQAAYSGAGKPSDIANIGSGYPSAGGATVTADSTFGGTSNATPVTAGEYARALYELRRMAAGANRGQVNGNIVVDDPSIPCNDTSDCPSVAITVHQLRAALFGAAADPAEAISAAGMQTVPSPNAEVNFASYGHGILIGRLNGLESLDAETARIVELALGADAAMPADELSWFIADSFCRQGIWGAWEFGDYATGASLPAPDPQWPMRTYYAEGCPDTLGTVKSVVELT